MQACGVCFCSCILQEHAVMSMLQASASAAPAAAAAATTADDAAVVAAGAAAAALSSFDFEVFGKVQGVFFRKHTKRFADANGLRGWCKNTPSGTVVGQAEGNASAIADFKRWLLRTGSPKSRIQRAEFRAERDNAAEAQFDSFKIIR